MVKSFEKDSDGQYPETKITDIVVLEKQGGLSALLMEVLLIADNMARTADLAHHFLEAVDQAAIASARWQPRR